MTEAQLLSQPTEGAEPLPGPARPEPRLRLIAQATAALVLVAATVLVALLPVAGRQVTYLWEPPTSFSSSKVQLMMPATPEELTGSWPCAAVRELAPVPGTFPLKFFSTGFSSSGELSAWVDPGGVTLQLDGRAVRGALLALPQENCTLQIGYDDHTRTVALTAGARTVSAALKTSVVPDDDRTEAVQVTGLEVAAPLRPDTRVEVVAQPSTQQWTTLQWAVALAGLFAAGYLWWSLFRLSRPGPPGRPSPRWTRWDSVVVGSAVAALFLIPPLADDGWVLTTVRAFPQLGFFSNFFTANAAAQPEGFWWTSIERLWLSPLEASVLALRVPSLVIGVLCWWFLRRRVLDQVGEGTSTAWLRGTSAAIYATLLMAWSPTLRPEPMVGLLAVIAVALVLRFRQRPDAWVLLTLALIPALAFSAHQTGWIVIGVAFAALPDMIRWLRRGPDAGVQVVLMAAVTFVGVAALLMMLKANMAVLVDARASFIEGGRHNAILDEGLRLRGLIDSDAAVPPVRLLSAMLVPAVALGWLVLSRAGWPASPARLAAGASALGGMFLAFTSSKWQWHFGATVGVVTVAGGLLAQRAVQSRRSSLLLLGVLAGLGFVAMLRPADWGLQALRVVDISEPVLGLMLQMLLWAGFATAVWFAIKRGRSRSIVLAASTAFVAGLVLLTSIGPILVDVFRAPATAWPRLVADSVKPGNCGLASALQVPTATNPLAKVPGQTPGDTIIESPWGNAQHLPVPPVPDVVTMRPAGAFPIPLATPWYAVDTSRETRTWVHAAQPGALGFAVEWQTADGRGGSSQFNRYATAPAWLLVPIEVPQEADRVRITWINSPSIDVVLSPVAVTEQAPLTSLVSGPVLRTPQSMLYASCFPQPDISQGAMSRFEWALGMPFVGQSTTATGVADFSEQACIFNQSGDEDDRLCWYRVANPAPRGLTTSTRTVQR